MLGEGQQRFLDKRIEELKADQEEKKFHDKRAQDIASKPKVKMVEFYCNKCKEDFKTIGYKDEYEIDGVKCARYVGKCSKRHVAVRFITDTRNDPYWVESRLIWATRREFEKELIQKDDSRHKALYGA